MDPRPPRMADTDTHPVYRKTTSNAPWIVVGIIIGAILTVILAIASYGAQP